MLWVPQSDRDTFRVYYVMQGVPWTKWYWLLLEDCMTTFCHFIFYLILKEGLQSICLCSIYSLWRLCSNLRIALLSQSSGALIWSGFLVLFFFFSFASCSEQAFWHLKKIPWMKSVSVTLKWFIPWNFSYNKRWLEPIRAGFHCNISEYCWTREQVEDLFHKFSIKTLYGRSYSWE